MKLQPISLLDLFRRKADGVSVPVPYNTKYIGISPSLCAIPLEIFADSSPSDARIQDNRLMHNPGATVYPGGSLFVPEGIQSFVSVRPIPGINAAFKAVNQEPVPEVVGATNPWGVVGGPSDAALISVVTAKLTLMLSGSVVGNDGSNQNGLLPSVLRIAAASDFGQADVRVIRSFSSGAPDVFCMVPHAVAPLEIIRKYTRARLRLVIGHHFDVAGQVNQRCAQINVNGMLVSRNQAWLPRYMGVYANGSSQTVLNCQEIVFDLGSPAELFSALFSYDSDFINGTLNPRWLKTAYGVAPAVIAEWVLDHGESKPGVSLSMTYASHSPTANATQSSMVHSPNGAGILLVEVTNAVNGDASLKMWPQGTDDVTDGFEQLTVPLPAVGVYTIPMPGAGDWQVGIYGGTGGAVANVRFHENA